MKTTLLSTPYEPATGQERSTSGVETFLCVNAQWALVSSQDFLSQQSCCNKGFDRQSALSSGFPGTSLLPLQWHTAVRRLLQEDWLIPR
jgi:hypothetical protein